MKYYYDPTTMEPITGILPASDGLPFKPTPPPEPAAGQYVLATSDGSAEDWELVAKGGAEWSLSYQQKAKHAEINQWRDKQIAENLLFAHAGHLWDGGADSWARVLETLALADTTGLPDGFYWTTADNIDVPVTAAEVQSLASAMAAVRGQRGFEIHARRRAMKAEVQALTTIEAVQAYPVGWPHRGAGPAGQPPSNR